MNHSSAKYDCSAGPIKPGFFLTIPFFRVFLAVMIILIHQGMHAQQNFFMTGRTKGPYPFLEFGLGDDRLGGAKMGYLDSNVLLRVVDSVQDDYKVQLSARRFAWLAKTSFRRDSLAQLRPYYLSGNCRVGGDSLYDYLQIHIGERLPYSSRQTLEPSRIEVDVYGLTSNTNWINQLLSAKEIRQVSIEQVEDDLLRFNIQLRHRQHWGHKLYYDSSGRYLLLKVRRQPSILSIDRLTIAIDAGHGGDNHGAKGVATGILEKDQTLAIAKELEKILRKAKVRTFMTRTKDTSLSITERLDTLAKVEPQVLISIHLNSAGSDTVRGASTYYRYPGFRPLAQSVLKRLLELKLKEFGNIGNFNFGLNGPTFYPNCLVEVAFLSNVEDEKRIRDPKFQKAAAQKIYLGIVDWLGSLK